MKGAIGPKRVFDTLYPQLKWTFLLGFLLGIVWWTAKRYGPSMRGSCQKALPSVIYAPLNLAVFSPISWLYSVHPSLLLLGFLSFAPYNLSYWTGGLYFSVSFMFYLRRYKTAWWEKYTYVLSAGLTGAVAFSGLIIFFAVDWKIVNVNWWGTEVQYNTIDGGIGQQTLLTPPADGFYIGTWQ